jgi:4-amino-4-deoxy-L-arabinose transferase-like glycosyltransferase
VIPNSRAGSLWLLAVLALFVSAVCRLIPTYSTLNGTFDEPFHIACGMEWLDKGTYTIELQHPPLGRVLAALGPYLKGLRSHSLPEGLAEGNAILFSGGQYWRNLTLARLGTLPLLAMSCLVIYLWAARWFTRAAGIWAVLLFVSLPPILAHSGLATTDMAGAATLLVAVYLFVAWLETPGRWQATWLGFGVGLAVLGKFSNFVFLPACFAVAIAVALVSRPSAKNVRRRLIEAGVAVAVALLVTWAGYRFSLVPQSSSRGSHPVADELLAGYPRLRAAASAASEIPLPLTQVARGLEAVHKHDREGHEAYLLGKYSKTGWWYFFPVVLAVKTPLAFLVLALVGIAVILGGRRGAPWQRAATVLFPLVILAISMTSRINLGVRHILAVYPFLALAAGHGVAVLAGDGKPRWRLVAPIVLVCLVVADSVAAHPDYLSYFNQLAGREPAQVVCDSDLDWGQDLGRLGNRLRALGVRRFRMAYFGSMPPEAAGLPAYDQLNPEDRPTGYVAVSARYLYLACAKSGAYCWLRAHTPVEKIGTSIYLYHFP